MLTRDLINWKCCLECICYLKLSFFLYISIWKGYTPSPCTHWACEVSMWLPVQTFGYVAHVNTKLLIQPNILISKPPNTLCCSSLNAESHYVPLKNTMKQWRVVVCYRGWLRVSISLSECVLHEMSFRSA